MPGVTPSQLALLAFPHLATGGAAIGGGIGGIRGALNAPAGGARPFMENQLRGGLVGGATGAGIGGGAALGGSLAAGLSGNKSPLAMLLGMLAGGAAGGYAGNKLSKKMMGPASWDRDKELAEKKAADGQQFASAYEPRVPDTTMSLSQLAGTGAGAGAGTYGMATGLQPRKLKLPPAKNILEFVQNLMLRAERGAGPGPHNLISDALKQLGGTTKYDPSPFNLAKYLSRVARVPKMHPWLIGGGAVAGGLTGLLAGTGAGKALGGGYRGMYSGLPSK